MAALRNAAIAALRAAETTNIAAANRHHARNSSRPWRYSASPNDFAGALDVLSTDVGNSAEFLKWMRTSGEVELVEGSAPPRSSSCPTLTPR